MIPTPLIDRLRAIEWLVLDVDGVLTDGGIVYDNHGVEQKRFHVRDGSGLKIWHHVGKRSAIITGRTSELVKVRAAELGIAPVVQGAAEKLPAYRRLLGEIGGRPEAICAIGDDVPDLGVLANSGLAVAVADACPDVRRFAHYVTRAGGGCGAVREVIELVLHAQGLWQPVVERFRREAL
jgi:3-deoxy-D-manno-octulosonate 8-phosphate phosphatase (KDO 8-P phosphatase)